MTNPKDNEELNDELSTDELKAVSGGIILDTQAPGLASCVLVEQNGSFMDFAGNESGFKSPKGSGSGMKLEDWKNRNHTNLGPGATFED